MAARDGSRRADRSRMTAHVRRCPEYRNRRPKAAREGKRRESIPSLKPACQQHGLVAGVRQNGEQQLECRRRSPLSAIGAGAPRRHAPTCLHSRYRPRASGPHRMLGDQFEKPSRMRFQRRCAASAWNVVLVARDRSGTGETPHIRRERRAGFHAYQMLETGVATSHFIWLISIAAIIVLSCSRAVRDPLAPK